MKEYRKMDNYTMWQRRKRREILIRGIRCACGIVATISFLYIFHIVGGLEQDIYTLGEATIRALVTLPILAVSTRIAIGDQI